MFCMKKVVIYQEPGYLQQHFPEFSKSARKETQPKKLKKN